MDELADRPLSEVAADLAAGRVPLATVLRSCARRIDARDGELRAWQAVDRGALAGDGAALAGGLAGVPVGVKDVFATAGLSTWAGSPDPVNLDHEGDAPAVARLRRSGATIIGKTRCTEFALNDPAPTRNPWDRTRTAGGSSVGSAVAVATGMCFATLDTQTAGDIVKPAAYNGIVGFKPTYGTISTAGTVPVAWSIDTVGVQARTVADVALLYNGLTGEPAEPPARPPVLGVVADPLLDRAEPEVQARTERAARTLRAAGAQVHVVHPPQPLHLAHAAHRIVTFAECATYHAHLLAQPTVHIGPKFRQLIELGAVTPAVSYLQAQRLRTQLVNGFQPWVGQADALLTPTVPAPAPADRTATGDSTFAIPWTFLGLPTITLPTGLSEERLPLAVQLTAAAGADTRLLATARWCEHALNAQLPAPAESPRLPN